MIKHIVFSLASLLTLVGGHFLNRRTDRAVLFFMLFIFSMLGIYYVMLSVLIEIDPEAYQLHFQRMTKLAAFVGISLLIISAVITFLDSMRSPSPHQNSWSVSGRIGATLMTLVGFLGAIYMVMLLDTVKITSGSAEIAVNDESDGTLKYRFRDKFFATAYFGGKGYIPKTVNPPKGEGYLVGVFEHDGIPVPGIQLEIILNDRYTVENLRTDKQGRFEINLPVGDWTINSITTSGWKNKPDGEYLLTSGDEPKYSGGFYSLIFNNNEGKVVKVKDRLPETPQVRLSIREQITLIKPGEQDKLTPMSLAKDALQWKAYPEAHQYLVEIRSITREGKRTSTMSVARKVVKGASQIPLSHFTTVEDDVSNEYSIRVTAFAEDGSFLSHSDDFPSSGFTFKLSEQRAFVDEKFLPSALGIPTKEQLELSMQNRKKFNAIELLISEKMYKPAKLLLDGIDEKSAQPGRKAAIMGYWFANQGQCDEAVRYFNQAREEGGELCIASDYLKKVARIKLIGVTRYGSFSVLLLIRKGV